MHILYDLTATQERGGIKYHGGGEYGKAVFQALTDQGNIHEVSVVYFKDRALELWVKDIIDTKKLKNWGIRSFNEIYNICKENAVDIFYTALPIAFQKRPVPSNVVMKGTIHGLRGIEMPADKFSAKYYTGKEKLIRICKNCFPEIVRKKHKIKLTKIFNMLDEFICVSDHTKFSIKAYFPEVCYKVSEVYYTPPKYQKISSKKYNKNEKIILIISSDRWLKNGFRALKALDELFQRNQLDGYYVISVGNMSKSIIKSITKMERFIFLDYISSEQLEDLYAICDIFLYPSLNEGFGMPPMEAMKYNKTCIVSGICSLPEIYGDAVYYVNPTDIGEIKARVLLAAERKIDSTVIKQKLSDVRERQEADLINICKFIAKKV